MIDHTATRVRQLQSLEQRKLQGLGGFDSEGVVPVDHACSGAFKVGQVLQGIKDSVAIAANVRGRAHPIENQRELAIRLADIKAMPPCVDADIGCAAAVQFVEQGTKPVLVLMVD